jgi:two-component system chemotaxis response regulator CheB
LRDLIRVLPADVPAALLVVLHLAPTATSALPQILGRAGRLEAKHAEHGEPIQAGHIYIAPPDAHLVLRDGHAVLDRGPKVNGHRPAIDALFRSAAEAYGAGGAGVVLSGVLDDGTVGLLAIKEAGGTTFVQDPGEALYPGMPVSAIEYVEPDYVAPAAELGRLLASFAQTSPPDPPSEKGTMRETHLEEVSRGTTEDPQPGESSGLTCPECQGAIWLTTIGGAASFRCRVGHEYTEESFAAADAARVETALWTSLRALEERADLHRRMSDRATQRGQRVRADTYARSATSALEDALVLRELLASFVADVDVDVDADEEVA